MDALSSSQVGQLYKNPNSCVMYEAHQLHKTIHNFFQDLLQHDNIDSVYAQGCHSCTSPHTNQLYYIQQTTSETAVTEVSLNYSNTVSESEIQTILSTADQYNLEIRWSGEVGDPIHITV
jgi:hypothetical protein